MKRKIISNTLSYRLETVKPTYITILNNKIKTTLSYVTDKVVFIYTQYFTTLFNYPFFVSS